MPIGTAPRCIAFLVHRSTRLPAAAPLVLLAASAGAGVIAADLLAFVICTPEAFQPVPTACVRYWTTALCGWTIPPATWKSYAVQPPTTRPHTRRKDPAGAVLAPPGQWHNAVLSSIPTAAVYPDGRKCADAAPIYHQFRQPLSIQMAGSAQILLQFLCVCCRLIVIRIGIF